MKLLYDTVIPGTNEIGAKLMDHHHWPCEFDCHGCIGWYSSWSEHEADAWLSIFASGNDARNLHKRIQRMIFAAVSTSLKDELSWISTQLVESAHNIWGQNGQMEHRYRLLTSMHTDVHEHLYCLLPWHCCMSYIQTASKTRAHLHYLWSVWSPCIYQCMYCPYTESNVMVRGGVMIGSIKRLNKLWDIRVGWDRR